MSVINEVIESVMDMINETNPFSSITRGALPITHGIVCEIGPTAPNVLHMDKNTVVPLDLTLNGKHEDLETLSDTMNNIHSALTRTMDYPSGDGWQIVDIGNAALPQKIGREENNDWLMASSLTVTFYWRGD